MLFRSRNNKERLKLYYFTFSLKYYFLIFFYYFFPIFTFFQDSNGKIFLAFELFFFFFQTCILQRSHFSWAMQHYFFSNSDVDSSGLSLAFIISFQQSFVFSNSTTIPNNLPIFFFFLKNLQNFFRKNMPNINILKTCKL